MPDLVSELRQLPLRRNIKQSRVTRARRSDLLAKMGKELLELGFITLAVPDLEEVHILALVTLWNSQGLDIRTLTNRLTTLRWWAGVINKPHIMHKKNALYGLVQVPRKFCTSCRKKKRLINFTHDRGSKDGFATRCLDCGRKRTALYDLTHRQEKRIYDATHKEERNRRDRERRRRLRTLVTACLSPTTNSAPRELQSPDAGVYFVQITLQSHLVKIGQTSSFVTRAVDLQREYGPLHLLLLIPHEAPLKLERLLHSYFAAMRIYDGASPTELFRFDTRAKQQFFERFLRQFQCLQVQRPQWSHTPKAGRAAGVSLQENLFA